MSIPSNYISKQFFRATIKTAFVLLIIGFVVLPLRLNSKPESKAEGRPNYRSPFALQVLEDRSLALVTDSTYGSIIKVDLESGKILGDLQLNGEPRGLVMTRDGSKAFVAESMAWTVAEIDVQAWKVTRRFEVGRRPLDLALDSKEQHLLVTNSVGHDVSWVSLSQGKTIQTAKLPREPFFVQPIPKSSKFLVGNLLPVGAPGTSNLKTVVTTLKINSDGDGFTQSHLELPIGSSAVRQIEIDSEGHRAYVLHTLGRIQVPATQLERGWVSTNALTIFDLKLNKRWVTVLLDSPELGASDPWGITLAENETKLWISLRGTHEVVKVHLDQLHQYLNGVDPEHNSTLIGAQSGSSRYRSEELAIWNRIFEDKKYLEDLEYDLRALGTFRLIERFPSGVKGPLDIKWNKNTEEVLVVGRFSGTLSRISKEGKLIKTLSLGHQPKADLIRRGEELFHDATISFQNWLSCATCHPDDGRNDGLRWDLPNDGLGTPQMTRSLIKSYMVAPTTARGVRAGFKVSSTAGFLFLHTSPTKERVSEVMAYLTSIEPEPSPFLAKDGKLNAAQKRGKVLFEGEADCVKCHKGEIKTDLEPHRIGTAKRQDVGGNKFYTPKLLELYRTAPFLHDGRAATLKDIFKIHNKEGKHGEADELSDDELDDLVEYLKTL